MILYSVGMAVVISGVEVAVSHVSVRKMRSGAASSSRSQHSMVC